MTVLVALVLVLISAIFIVGLIFVTLFSQHSRSQYLVDGLALSMAKSINSGDRVAQMNQLVARNRELVYMYRENYKECERQGLSHLAPLCDQLMDEAYSANSLVEHERKNQIGIISNEVRQMAHEYEKHRSSENNSWLPYMGTFEPKVMRIDVGCIRDVESNVQSLTTFPELAEFERGQGFVQARSNLFKSNINVRLPAPDERLRFTFAALPAYIDATCSPPRVANPEVFKPFTSIMLGGKNINNIQEFIPPAVHISADMEVALDPEHLNRHSVRVGSVGVTGGALSSPE
ncbi:MAG: hypothetical protein K2X93_18690 [Candidatus Obscuribacterales bacterium]|nr:hypothetical protein [Candidatus Obscuribacterales bacterium]